MCLALASGSVRGSDRLSLVVVTTKVDVHSTWLIFKPASKLSGIENSYPVTLLKPNLNGSELTRTHFVFKTIVNKVQFLPDQ
jgi:hypothetical protein